MQGCLSFNKDMNGGDEGRKDMLYIHSVISYGKDFQIVLERIDNTAFLGQHMF